MSACQTPQLSQDATAAAVSGGGLLAAAAARGLARAAMQCCSKVAEHLAGEWAGGATECGQLALRHGSQRGARS